MQPTSIEIADVRGQPGLVRVNEDGAAARHREDAVPLSLPQREPPCRTMVDKLSSSLDTAGLRNERQRAGSHIVCDRVKCD